MQRIREIKIASVILVIVSSLFFSGNVYSETSSALMKALTSPQAEMLSGDEGVYIIFVQSLDGVSTVKNVEALDTLYLLAAQGEEQMLVFEADKTNKELRLLNYKLLNTIWIETAIYNPAELPDIDFQEAHRLVKEASGKDKTIASISVFYALFPEDDLIVSFQMKGDSPYCEQWQYHVATGDVWQTAFETMCFYQMP
jgi:hypothetical protein